MNDSISGSAVPRTFLSTHVKKDDSAEDLLTSSKDKGPKGKESEYKYTVGKANLHPDVVAAEGRVHLGNQVTGNYPSQLSKDNVDDPEAAQELQLSRPTVSGGSAGLATGCKAYCVDVIKTTIARAKAAGERPTFGEGMTAALAYSIWYMIPAVLQNFIDPANRTVGLVAFTTLSAILNTLTSPDLRGEDARRFGAPHAPDTAADEDRISLLTRLVDARREGNPARELECEDLMDRLVASVEQRVRDTNPPFAFDDAMLGVYVRRIVSDLAYLTWGVALLIPGAMQPILNQHLGSNTWALKAANAAVSVVSGLVVGGFGTWWARRLMAQFVQKTPTGTEGSIEILEDLEVRIRGLQKRIEKNELQVPQEQIDELKTTLEKALNRIAREKRILHPGGAVPEVNRGLPLFGRLAGDALGGLLTITGIVGIAYQFSVIYGAMGNPPAASFGGSYNGTHNATSEGMPGDIAGVTEMTAGLFMAGAICLNRWLIGPAIRKYVIGNLSGLAGWLTGGSGSAPTGPTAPPRDSGGSGTLDMVTVDKGPEGEDTSAPEEPVQPVLTEDHDHVSQSAHSEEELSLHEASSSSEDPDPEEIRLTPRVIDLHPHEGEGPKQLARALTTTPRPRPPLTQKKPSSPPSAPYSPDPVARSLRPAQGHPGESLKNSPIETLQPVRNFKGEQPSELNSPLWEWEEGADEQNLDQLLQSIEEVTIQSPARPEPNQSVGANLDANDVDTLVETLRPRMERLLSDPSLTDEQFNQAALDLFDAYRNAGGQQEVDSFLASMAPEPFEPEMVLTITSPSLSASKTAWMNELEEVTKTGATDEQKLKRRDTLEVINAMSDEQFQELWTKLEEKYPKGEQSVVEAQPVSEVLPAVLTPRWQNLDIDTLVKEAFAEVQAARDARKQSKPPEPGSKSSVLEVLAKLRGKKTKKEQVQETEKEKEKEKEKAKKK